MACRKVVVLVTTRVTMLVDEGVEIQTVVNELEHNFSDTTGSATVEDSIIENHEVVDSK